MIAIVLLICLIYCIWFVVANLKGKCPKGSKNSGFRSCVQPTHAYIPPQASKNPLKKGFYCSKKCKEGYFEKLPAGCAHTCVKPCMEGFKRRSNAAGSAFCDAKMKTKWFPFI